MPATVIAFVAGAFLSGVVFVSLHLEAEEKADRRGFEEGRNSEEK